MLNLNIGDQYIKYYKLDSNSYYRSDRFFKKSVQHDLIPDQSIKGNFVEASVRFTIQDPNLKELRSTLYLRFFSNGDIETFCGDIPQFILDNRPYDFIPKERIISIGDSLLKEEGVKIDYLLFRDLQLKKFIWEIGNVIRECSEDRFADGLIEIIKIDPITGEIIDYYKGKYGIVF